ncbi:MAG: hypothetical protein IPK81_19590 [Rhodospirillales bacterium]|nr:MAG: hypothetical protein IPK81_19590 [Rhodospirillales bacterium]
MSGRPLREDEAALLRGLLADKPEAAAMLARLADYRVEDMNDGGMSGVRFLSGRGENIRRYGSTIASAWFTDSDGMAVSVGILLDVFDDLFEIDIWRVDFGPLLAYPVAEQAVDDDTPHVTCVHTPTPMPVGWPERFVAALYFAALGALTFAINTWVRPR